MRIEQSRWVDHGGSRVGAACLYAQFAAFYTWPSRSVPKCCSSRWRRWALTCSSAIPVSAVRQRGVLRPRRLRRGPHDQDLARRIRWVHIGFGVLAAIVGALLIGPFLFRRRGIYFSLLTIAFGQVFYFLAYRFTDITGGEDGMTFPRPAVEWLGWQLKDRSHFITRCSRYFMIVAILCSASGSLAVRPLAGRDQAERNSRPASGPQYRSLYLRRDIDLGGNRRFGRRVYGLSICSRSRCSSIGTSRATSS